MGLKPEITITPMGLLVGVGLLVGGYAMWRSVQAIAGVAQGAGDMVNGLLAAPGRIVQKTVEAAREGGRAYRDIYEPNEVNRVNTKDVFTPVYNDPMVNDDGMDFRYF
jgi:hypothetical protein